MARKPRANLDESSGDESDDGCPWLTGFSKKTDSKKGDEVYKVSTDCRDKTIHINHVNQMCF